MQKFKVLFLFILTINLCFSQTSIWKISKNNNKLYLGGSVHVLRSTDYPLPIEFNSVYNMADEIVLEADVAQLENPDLAEKFWLKNMLLEGKTLDKMLDKEVYAKLELSAEAISLPIGFIASLNPSIAILMITVMKLKEIGYTEDGVDKYFFNKSVKDKKALSYLESIEKQMEVILKMGEGNENDYVKYALADLDKIEKKMPKLVSSWRTANEKQTIKLLRIMESKLPNDYESLLVERNNDWLPKIELLLADDKIEFIIVGALHLYGKDGLLKMLAEKGYKVEQFRNN